MFPARPRNASIAGALATLLLGLLPAVGRAAAWDTYNNANALNTVAATGSAVWCGSDFGLHRYDPATNRFTRFSKNNDGLASNAINAIAVDAAGNTWFGTNDRGVSVLTAGGTWRTIDTFQGLPSDVVRSLRPSPLGMWIGTSLGLAVFDDRFQLTAVWPDGVNPSPFRSKLIRDVVHFGDSTWVATEDGIYITKTDEGLSWIERSAGLTTRLARSLAGQAGVMWCVSGNRIHRGGETGTWTLEETGLPGGTTATSLAARGSDLIAGTTSGVFRWDGAQWQIVGTGNPVNAAVDFDPNGGIWAGNGEGLWQWNTFNWQRRVSPGPDGNWVHAMALQGSKLYLTTRFNGVSRFDGTSWRTFLPGPGATPDTTLLSADYIFGLLVDADGTKWLGDWGHALSRMDDSVEPPVFTQYYDATEGAFDAKNTFVWSSAQDPQGNRWFGLDTDQLGVVSPKGINRISPSEVRTNYNPQTAAMSGPQVRAIAFAPGPGFEMWVAYAGLGVDIYTDPTLSFQDGRITTPSLLSNDTWSIQMYGDSVWVATSSGLSRFSRATRQLQENVGTQPPSSRGAVNPFAIDAEGGLWWGTLAGLYHRRPGRTVEVFSETNSPLLSNDIHSIVVDRASGDVWIGTIVGVNRYNPGATSGGGGGSASGARFNVWPNPAFLSSAGVSLHTTDFTGPYKGRVFDLKGRVLRHLLGNATTGTLWDAKDEHGVPVRPGLYILEVTQGSTVRTGRVYLIR